MKVEIKETELIMKIILNSRLKFREPVLVIQYRVTDDGEVKKIPIKVIKKASDKSRAFSCVNMVINNSLAKIIKISIK